MVVCCLYEAAVTKKLYISYSSTKTTKSAIFQDLQQKKSNFFSVTTRAFVKGHGVKLLQY